MSVYSEKFLQVNVVNYKMVLIRNHKKKVLQKYINNLFRFGLKEQKEKIKVQYCQDKRNLETSLMKYKYLI